MIYCNKIDDRRQRKESKEVEDKKDNELEMESL